MTSKIKKDGLSVDEVTDVSNWEQLGIIVRYA